MLSFPLHPEQQLHTAPVATIVELELAAIDQFRNRAPIGSIECLDVESGPNCQVLFREGDAQGQADTVLMCVTGTAPGDSIIIVRVKDTPTHSCFRWIISWEAICDNSTALCTRQPSPPEGEPMPRDVNALCFPYVLRFPERRFELAELDAWESSFCNKKIVGMES